ncbi:WSC domain-containing protein [Mycena sanguinolenta]|nr:WSC domain-containing protein [Mycena sanguinolenta]
MVFSTLHAAAAFALLSVDASVLQGRANPPWIWQGCYTDTSTSRTLAEASTTSVEMTVESCIAFCTAGGFSLAGVEFGDECYCDYAMQSTGATTRTENCNKACSGNPTESCGAVNFIDIFWNGTPPPIIPAQVGTWLYVGCFSDSVSARQLPHLQTISGGVTVESCTAACKTSGFSFAGLEDGQECWCGSSAPTTSSLGNRACTTACVANTKEVCGGPSKLTVYKNVMLHVSTELITCRSTHQCALSSDTSTSRTLAEASTTSANMTVESCIAFCTAGGFSLAGVEFGDECYCDYAIQSTCVITSTANCNEACSGNPSELCGAGNFIDIYWNGTPPPITPQQVGTWEYVGCFSDSVSARQLAHQQTISGGVTVESCTAACKTSGFSFAGLEDGQECWCGSSVPTSSLGNSACATACVANTREFCGGPSKLSVYEDPTGQICLESTISTNFNLAAVSVAGGAAAPTALHVNIITTVPLISWSILTVRLLSS